MDDARSLYYDQRILQAAITDQKHLADMVADMPASYGLDWRDYQQQEAKLKLRLVDVQRRIIDLEP